MTTSDKPAVLGTFTLPPFPKLTPLEQAQRAIAYLSINRPDLAPIQYFGGTREVTPEELAQNELRAARYQTERREIIFKYGVEEHYLAELRKEEVVLIERLGNLRGEICNLEILVAERAKKA